MEILWWHWVVAGILMSALEIIVPGFIIIWFGLSAIIIGIADKFFVFDLSTALYLWSGLSIIMLTLWFSYFKKTWRSDIGQADGEYRHIKGIITEELEHGRYRARFDLPVLGDREWIVESKDRLSTGDKISVVKVYGQILKVKPTKED